MSGSPEAKQTPENEDRRSPGDIIRLALGLALGQRKGRLGKPPLTKTPPLSDDF
jgi:hypothetical protein